MAVIGDLATDAGADAVSDAAGDVDVLVNNAGYYDGLPWSAVTAEMWAQIFEVNVISAVRLIERLVPAMRRRGWGRVIQIGGGLALQPVADQPHNNATLAARHNLTVSLARDLAGTGVTANTVAPGAILTGPVREMTSQVAAKNGWARGGRTPKPPRHRSGFPTTSAASADPRRSPPRSFPRE